MHDVVGAASSRLKLRCLGADTTLGDAGVLNTAGTDASQSADGTWPAGAVALPRRRHQVAWLMTARLAREGSSALGESDV